MIEWIEFLPYILFIFALGFVYTVPANDTDYPDELYITQLQDEKLDRDGAIPLTGILNLGAIGQIAFPSIQNPSAGANVLDDYEEGEWTFDLKFGGAKVGITYDASFTKGAYTKIGNLVAITGRMVLTSKGTSVGTVVVYGLPFIVKFDNTTYSAVSLRPSKITFANQMMGLASINMAGVVLLEVTEGGVETGLTNADFANDSEITFGFTYITA